MASDGVGVDASPVKQSAAKQSNVDLLFRLLFGFMAGGAVFALISSANPIFTVPEKYHIQGLGESDERWQALAQQKLLADQKNSAVFLGTLGALVAVVVALRSGSKMPLGKRIALSLPMGLVGGVAAGVVSSWLQSHYVSKGLIELTQSTTIYAAMCGLLGAGVGCGAGLSSATPWNTKTFLERLATGLVIGAIAGAAFPIVSSLLVNAANTEALIPENSINLALLLLLPSVALSLAVAGTNKPADATAA